MSGLDVFDDHWTPRRHTPEEPSIITEWRVDRFYARGERFHSAVSWWCSNAAVGWGDLINCGLPTDTAWLIPIWLPGGQFAGYLSSRTSWVSVKCLRCEALRCSIPPEASLGRAADAPRCHNAESSAEGSGQTLPLAGQRHFVRLPVRRRRPRPSAHRAEGTHGLEPHAQRGHRGDKFPWKLQLLLATCPGEEIPREVGGNGFSETTAGPKLCFSSGYQCFLYR